MDCRSLHHYCRLLPIAILSLAFAPCVVGQTPASPDTTEATVETALATVDSLRQAGRFSAARQRLETMQKERPDDVAVLWRLVYTWADLGQATDEENARKQYYKQALRVAEAGLAADSTDGRAHLAMAVAQGRAALDAGTRERIERSRAVKHHADRAIAIDSTLDGAYHVRGRWHREVEDLGFLKRTIVRTVYGGLPESSLDQAVRDFKRAIALDDRLFHHLELGKTYRQMDRPQAARREFQVVLQMPAREPFDPEYKAEARKLLDDLD